ncbi:hypothetical protein [Streptomyces sp. NPDC003832]
MGFPLDIRTDLFIGGTWQDISSDVYLREVKNLVRGMRDMSSTADPSRLQLTLNNRSGKYSARNAMGPLFGLIGRNTPLRVSLPSDGDHYLQLDGREGCYASTPDTASLDITGDLDVRMEIAPDWYGSNSQTVIGKWDRPTLQQSWMVSIVDGAISLQVSTAGDVYAGGYGWSRALPVLPERAAIRITLDVDNGAGGRTFTFYTAESLDGPWEVLSTHTLTNGTAPIFSGSAPLQIGVTDFRNGIARPRYPLHGRAYRFEVRSGIDGPVVASPDFRSATPGATSITDAQGLVWTLGGSAEIRDREDRFLGEVAEWPLRWSTDDADRYVPITANGILRRLGQGAKALDSTLRRRIPSGNPIAYWPMEEGENAVQAYSPIPGVLPASVSSVEWAQWNTLPSSAPLPRLTGESSLSAQVPAATPGEWQVEVVYTADDNPPIGVDVEFLKIYSTTGTVRRWEILYRSGRATLYGYNWTNTLVISRLVGVGADIFHGWVRARLFCKDRGDGSFDYGIAWQDVGGDAGGVTGTYTGTCGSVSLVAADWPALTEGWGVGHLAVLRTANSDLYSGSDDAYRGELSHERIRRLATEERLSFTRKPGRLVPAAVGYQRRNSLVNLLESAADGDGGLLTEDMNRIGLHYRDRSSMYTQEPLITLSYTAPGLGPDIEPVDDDSGVVNDVTVTRDGGTSARAVLESGPLSVEPAPAGIGKYDAAHTVSLAEDDQVESVAYWRLHLGTWDSARYPSIPLLLHKPGAEWLIPLVQRLREGDKIRLTNLPEWVSHDDVDLLVMGWAEQLDVYRWTITLNCVPAGPWDTAITDHPLFAKADTDGTIVGKAVTSTDTALPVRVTAGNQWTTDPVELPYRIRVAGEVMEVTAAGPSVSDTFGRDVVNGWGPADFGGTWVNTGGVAANYFVSAGEAKQSLSTNNQTRISTLPAPSADLTLQADLATSVLATGDGHYTGLVARYTDGNNLYHARLFFGTTQLLTLALIKRVGGTQTTLASMTIPGTHAAGRFFTLRFELRGSSLKAKAWQRGTAEPASWQLTATDTAITAVGSVGVRSTLTTSNTNTLPVNVAVDNVAVTDCQTFTVTRSVNGVVKAQAADASVQLAHPAITSL